MYSATLEPNARLATPAVAIASALGISSSIALRMTSKASAASSISPRANRPPSALPRDASAPRTAPAEAASGLPYSAGSCETGPREATAAAEKAEREEQLTTVVKTCGEKCLFRLSGGTGERSATDKSVCVLCDLVKDLRDPSNHLFVSSSCMQYQYGYGYNLLSI